MLQSNNNMGNVSSSPRLPPPARSGALLTLLAVCDVTLKMHDSHTVSVSMGLLCALQLPVNGEQDEPRVLLCECGQALKAGICRLTDGCGRQPLRINAPERDRKSCLLGRRLRAGRSESGRGG